MDDYYLGLRIARQNKIAEAQKLAVARLDQMADAGVRHIIWIANDDEATCHLCRRRDGKRFTLAAARALLRRNYCCAFDKEDREFAGCRCGLRPVVD